MKHPERITAETRLKRRRLTGPGWIRVYAILAAGVAVLFYFATRKP